MKKVIHKSNKICAMCRFWNNGRGCNSLNPKTGGFFEIDNKENQKYYKTGLQKGAFHSCGDYQSNY